MAIVSNINSAGAVDSLSTQQKRFLGPEETTNFRDFLTAAMHEADEKLDVQEVYKDALLSGEINNLHEVPIALTESELTLNLAIQIRNKVIDAYNEVMRIQV